MELEGGGSHTPVNPAAAIGGTRSFTIRYPSLLQLSQWKPRCHDRKVQSIHKHVLNQVSRRTGSGKE